MLHVPKALGGTVRWRAPRRADAGPTVEILTGDGGEIVTAGTAATLSSVNTTIAAAVVAESEQIVLTSNTGIVVGDEYRVGPNSAGQSEFVRVKGLQGTTGVTTQFPLQHGYQSTNVFAGTYISYAVDGATVPVPEDNCRAIFTWLVSSAAQGPGIVRFDVIEHWINHMPCTMNDVRSLDAHVMQRLPQSFDYDATLQLALNDVIRDVNQTLRASAVLADDDWGHLVAIRFLAGYAAPYHSEEGSEYRRIWDERYQERFKVLKAQFAADEDQDGVIEPVEERRGIGGELSRA